MTPADGLNPVNPIHTPVRTTYLVSNLDCPSYVSNIQHALSSLQPRPSLISPSIVSRLVTVHHDALLLEADISRALKETGCEIDSVFQDFPTSAHPIYYASSERSSTNGDGLLQKVLKGGILRHEHARKSEEEKSDTNVEQCASCRAARDVISPISFDQQSWGNYF